LIVKEVLYAQIMHKSTKKNKNEPKRTLNVRDVFS